MHCYCRSGLEFENCCQPFIAGIKKPATAEELMRSRYAAYATGAIEYLLRSTHPATRKFHDAGSIEKWAKQSVWQNLEIVAKSGGEATDKKGTVEFKAYFLDAENLPQIHHERSNFAKELGKWFFVDGVILS